MREIVVSISNQNSKTTALETINAIKAAGFENAFIQWYNEKWKFSQKKQLRYARKIGLKITTAHLKFRGFNVIWNEGRKGDRLVKQYIKDINNCKKNNISLVIMHAVVGFIAPSPNALGLERIKKITDYAKKAGVKIAFENIKIREHLKYVLSNITEDNIGLCFDSGHYHAFFDNNFDFETYKGRIFEVHLHDNHGSEDEHLIPFDGTVNWKEIIKHLKESEYKGPITLELIYSKKYSNMSVTDFYRKAYKTGEKLQKMFDEY